MKQFLKSNKKELMRTYLICRLIGWSWSWSRHWLKNYLIKKIISKIESNLFK
jgi:hypothetical protein